MNLKDPRNREQLKTRANESSEALCSIKHLELTATNIKDASGRMGGLKYLGLVVDKRIDIQVDEATMMRVVDVVSDYLLGELDAQYKKLYESLSEATIVK